jgi:hypothetical protein
MSIVGRVWRRIWIGPESVIQDRKKAAVIREKRSKLNQDIADMTTRILKKDLISHD